jgi:transcriptional regulator with XRE-family HTH domain
MIGNIITPLTKEERDEIREAIKNRRLAKGITQKAVGDALGVPHHTISLFELGKHSADLDSLVEIAKVLQSNILELVSEESYNKLSPKEVIYDTVEDILATTPSEIKVERDEENIEIPDFMIDKIKDNNPYNISINDIIAAGINYFVYMSPEDQLQYIAAMTSNKSYAIKLIEEYISLEQYDKAKEVIARLESSSFK